VTILFGLAFAVAGAIGVWDAIQRDRHAKRERSQWALRARVMSWLFLLGGLFVVVQELLRTMGFLDR
jgi:hypothetical protein